MRRGKRDSIRAENKKFIENLEVRDGRACVIARVGPPGPISDRPGPAANQFRRGRPLL